MKKNITILTLLLLVTFSVGAKLTFPQQIQVSNVNPPLQEGFEVGQQDAVSVPSPTLMPIHQSFSDVNMADDEVMIYAYRMVASAGYMHGWYRFPSSGPWNMEAVKDFGSAAGDYGISAATYAKGKTFVYVMQHYGTDTSGWNDYQMPIGIGTMDHETGEFTVLYDTSQNFHYFEYSDLIFDMAYDPVTDTVYAYTWSISDAGEFLDYTDIYSIDQETCEPTLIGRLDRSILAMAANNGRIYGLRQDYDEDAGQAVTSILSFDLSKKVDGVFPSEHVVDIFNGHTVNYAIQTLEFDLTTHNLWWMGFKNNVPFLGEINLENGRILNEVEIPYSAQHRGMIIPYQSAPDEAPARVAEMKVIPAENGVGEATIRWKNPTTNYLLGDLSELSGVKIYRNEELITTVQTTEVGAEMTYVDTNVPSGMYTYKLIPYNSVGDGLYREYTIFVGEDVPGMVGDLRAEKNYDEATISWTAPVEGLNGGWYDASKLRYNVYRGSEKVANEIAETTITDKVSFYAAHEYTIEPITDAGEGAVATIIVTFGTAVELPYENQFETKEKADEVIVLDGNGDGITWYYTEGFEGYAYTMSATNVADDYLVLPPVNLKSGKKYQLRFYYYTSNWYGTEEKVEVLVGDGMTTDKLTTVVDKFTFEGGANGANWHETHTEYKAKADGIFNFAFKCVSDANMGFVILSHVQLREMADVEVMAESISGPLDTYVGVPAEYTVTVKNYGVAVAPTARVRLLDFDGVNTVVLAETTIENLGVSETRDVKISWTPSEVRDYRIYGSIRSEEDPFTWDNATFQYLNVHTNPADGDRWITIGTARTDIYDDRLIDINRSYSRSQWFFYPDEIGGDFKITGLRLHYMASEDAEFLNEVPLVIRMTNTTRDAFLDSGYEYGHVFMSKDELTTVFDGNVDISGLNPEMNILEIKFSEPFEYSSDYNLLLDIEKEWEDIYLRVNWYFDINPNYQDRLSEYEDAWGYQIYYGRGGFYNWHVPYEEDPWNTAIDYFPFIKFSYTDTGNINTIDTKPENVVKVTNNALIFSENCEVVEVYGIAGSKVLEDRNVNALSTEQLPVGVYVVKAVLNGEVTTVKVMIK